MFLINKCEDIHPAIKCYCIIRINISFSYATSLITLLSFLQLLAAHLGVARSLPGECLQDVAAGVGGRSRAPSPGVAIPVGRRSRRRRQSQESALLAEI